MVKYRRGHQLPEILYRQRHRRMLVTQEPLNLVREIVMSFTMLKLPI
jgi:hypothetical protein